MRSFPRVAGRALAAAVLALGLAAAGSGTAQAGAPGPAADPGPAAAAATRTLYAPSALVLSVTTGAEPAEGTVLRAVTLGCAPRPTGTHPDPVAACAELRATQGSFEAITTGRSDRACTKEWDPVTVSAVGVWQGRQVGYHHVFANGCGLRGGSGVLFGF
ncbi:subtilase-type protease inhibitor [Streptomyces sp. BI20]|uniref:subtilase-type protease inhibitor n=1 Tax=Streptomyces sp. BI20 TaxID=3403460 RepID=UPI003C709DD5